MHNGDYTKNHEIQGHFLYADYSPLEDNRNVVEMLNAFVSLADRMIKLRLTNESLSSVLDDSDSLHNDIVSAIKEIRSSTTSTIEDFRNRHSGVLASELFTDSTILLGDTKDALMKLLSDTETGFAQKHRKYKDKIVAMIKENEEEAIALVHVWLSNEYANLPRPILVNVSSSVVATLDFDVGLEQYRVFRVASRLLSESEGGMQRKAMRFSYTTKINTNEIEFWNRSRKVAELGIRELMLPVGMKEPISEKLKQTLKFGLGNSEPAREPDFRKVDDYYVVSAELHSSKELVLQLASELARPSSNLFKITYDLNDLLTGQEKQGPSGTLPSISPQIDYRTERDISPSELTDLLQMDEIKNSTDLSKISLLGTAVLSKMGILTDPITILSRGRLESLDLEKRRIIAHEPQRIDFANLFEFLRLIGLTFYPTLKKLKEKTLVREEIIIRQELAGGQRKEFTVRLDDIRSQLADERYGKPILEALDI